jgi:hypothetical protein
MFSTRRILFDSIGPGPLEALCQGVLTRSPGIPGVNSPYKRNSPRGILIRPQAERIHYPDPEHLLYIDVGISPALDRSDTSGLR